MIDSILNERNGFHLQLKGKTVIVDPIFYFIMIFQLYFYRFRYGIWTK